MSMMNSSDRPVRSSAAVLAGARFDQAQGQRSHDGHRAGDGQAVGAGQRRRAAETQHQRQRGDHQNPIHGRHVDLPGVVAEECSTRRRGNNPKLTACSGHREDAGDHRLRCDDGCRGGDDHQRPQRPGGRHQIEGIADGRRILDQHRTLTEIIAHQRRHDDGTSSPDESAPCRNGPCRRTSASPPVTPRTLPRERRASRSGAAPTIRARASDRAPAALPARARSSSRPSRPGSANQPSITGPNTLPTEPVPCR